MHPFCSPQNWGARGAKPYPESATPKKLHRFCKGAHSTHRVKQLLGNAPHLTVRLGGVFDFKSLRVHLNACCLNLWCVTGRTVPILATDKIRASSSLTHPTQLFYKYEMHPITRNFVHLEKWIII